MGHAARVQVQHLNQMMREETTTLRAENKKLIEENANLVTEVFSGGSKDGVRGHEVELVKLRKANAQLEEQNSQLLERHVSHVKRCYASLVRKSTHACLP